MYICTETHKCDNDVCLHHGEHRREDTCQFGSLCNQRDKYTACMTKEEYRKTFNKTKYEMISND